MRLARVEDGQRPPEKLKLRMLTRLLGDEPSDVFKLCLYRPEFFGTAYLELVQDVMRGPSDWSVGERELFAVFVASQNRCRFCVDAHGAVAAYALGDDVVGAVLADWKTAPVNDKLRATLGLLEKLTLAPADVRAEDVERVRVAGVRDEAIVDALYVCAIFNLIDRVADALGFHVASRELLTRAAPHLLAHGYT